MTNFLMEVIEKQPCEGLEKVYQNQGMNPTKSLNMWKPRGEGN